MQKFFLLWLLLAHTMSNASNFSFTPSVTIVTDTNTSTLQNAARELHYHLSAALKKQVLVKTISTLKQENFNQIIVIAQKTSPFSKKLPLFKQLQKVKEDGFLIQITPHRIYLLGTNERALFYAIYHFLEKYIGYRFLSPDFTYTPTHTSLSLTPTLEIQEPHFAYREILVAESDDWHFALRRQLNGRLGHRTTSSYNDDDFAPSKKIFNNFFAYDLVPQEQYHCNGQLPFHAKEVRTIATQNLAKKLQNYTITKEDYLLLQHQDVNSFCPEDGTTKEEATKAFMEYGNFITTHLPSPYNNYHYLIEAYQWSRTPPKKMHALPKNLSVIFSTIEANFAKPLQAKTNRPILSDLIAWQKYTNTLFVWHYITNFGNYLQPYPNLLSIAQDLKTFSQQAHIKGVFLQGAYESEGSEFAALRIWLFSKLLWNPSLDPKKLIQDFCHHYYGNGAKEVENYIYTLTDFVKNTKEKLLLKTAPNAAYLSPKRLQKLRHIIQKALTKTKATPIYHDHVKEVLANLDYVTTLNATQETIPKKRLLRYLQKNPRITHYAEGAKIESLKAIIHAKRKTPPPPREAKGLKEGTQWLDFQAYNLRLCCTKMKEDPKASDGLSAVMDGKSEEWGFQLDLPTNLPKGVWDLYARVKITLDPDTSLLEQSKPALFFGIHPTFIKGAMLIAQLPLNRYKTIKIATLDTTKLYAEYLWISPPGNESLKRLFVDRIFAIKHQTD